MLFDELKVGQCVSHEKDRPYVWYGVITQKDERSVSIKWLNPASHVESPTLSQWTGIYSSAKFFSELKPITEEDLAMNALAHLGT